MKKFVLAILMAVCASGMHAQTEDVDTININVEAPIEELSGTNEEQDIKPNLKNSKKMSAPKSKDNFEDMESMFRRFNAMAMANQQVETKTDYSKIYFPVEGKSKFWRRHHIVQQLAISVLGGSDDDGQEEAANVSNDQYDDEQERYEGKPNIGISFGMSFLFIPGKVEGDNLRLNRFGAGYSIGFLTSFDKQEHYGVTCDFLLKLGLETGYGHKMGIGFDLLLGTGKSTGMSYYLDDDMSENDDMDTEPYTNWCFKKGCQFWVRSSLLSTGINNSNVRFFIRFVDSKNPTPEIEHYDGGIKINNWMDESWQVGIELCHNF